MMNLLKRVLLVLAVASAPVAAQQRFADPLPPAASEKPQLPAPQAADHADLTFHHAPKPLAKDAVTHDWESFLGPSHNAVSAETHLLEQIPPKGPPIVWEVKKGSGYAAPAISGDRLVLFHRLDDKETVDC